MRYLIIGVIALILVGSVYASVLITTDNKASGYNDAAYFAYQSGNKDSAVELYTLAIKEDSTYQLARYNLATLFFELGEYTKAVQQLEILVQMDKNNVKYKYDLAVNLVEQMRQNNNGWEHFDKALNLYYEVENMQPGFAHARENIAVMERIKSA